MGPGSLCTTHLHPRPDSSPRESGRNRPSKGGEGWSQCGCPRSGLGRWCVRGGGGRDEWREGCCREGWVPTHTPSLTACTVYNLACLLLHGVCRVTPGELQVCGARCTHAHSPTAGIFNYARAPTPSAPSPPAPARGYPAATPPRAPLLRFLSPPPLSPREEGLGVGIFSATH